MSSDALAQGIEAARRRLAALEQRAGGSTGQQPMAAEALEEISTLLEELHAAAEEMRRQNEELVLSHQDLEAERQRYRDLFEGAPDGYLVTDPEGTIREANRAAAELLGVRQDFLIGKPIRVFIAAEAMAGFNRGLTRVREGTEPPGDWEVSLQPRDAVPFSALLTVGHGRDPAGRLAGLRWLVRDISGRKRTEAMTRQAQKMEALGTLASGIAHDFNNILAAVIGHTQAASDSLPASSLAVPHLQEILAVSQRAKDIVRQILTFSRAGRERHGPVPLHSVVAEGMSLVRASLPENVELRLHIDPQSSPVSGNATQIHQVLMNLCANAEYAMRPRGGILEVRVEPFEVTTEIVARHPSLSPGPHVKLTVRDTGHGMERHVRERIFDPFFTTKGVGEGTGLGLAVVHGIVAGHRGAIRVESTPGQGTRFEIFFPRYESPPAAPLDGDLACAGRERLLIVDDEPFLARLWVTLLESLGYRCVACSSAAEALTAFRGAPESFDLVITDLVMPGMTGDALAREILRIRPDIPIILCTGFSHTMTEAAAKAIGFRAYLEKPLGRRELAQAIRSVLGQPATPNAS